MKYHLFAFWKQDMMLAAEKSNLETAAKAGALPWRVFEFF
jgi:hypothetical protein